MVILIKYYGNHSNRLLQNAHLEAYCIEFNLSFQNLTLYDLDKYYNYKSNWFSREFLFIIKVLRKLKIKIPIIFFSRDYKEVVHMKELNKSLVMIEGWFFREHLLTRKYQKYFAKKYSLKDKYFRNNLMYLKLRSINRDHFKVVGVHIRRGDYQTYQDGKYFFDDNAYYTFMEKIKDLIYKEFKKTSKFIIFSNEHTSFLESENILVSKNEWYIDHHLMSLCDFLIGPPSSFTLWASFVGKVPYYHMKTINDTIILEDFLLSDL